MAAIAVLIAGCGANAGSGPAARSTAVLSPTAARPTAIPLATNLPAEITHDDAMRLFEYDRSLPLDIREEGVTAEGGATIHAFNYRDMSGKRDLAFLVLPTGAGPFGAAMFLSGGVSGRGEFESEAVYFAGQGIASLLLDYPEMYPVPVTDQEAVAETIFETREFSRLFDWLAARPDVDLHRLGLVGVSYGAVRAATFAGVEGGRLKVAVLMSVPASYGTTAMAPFDPIAWAPYVSPCSLHIQEGTQDAWFTRADAESLLAAAREPKQLVWYEAGHGLNDQATIDYRAWLVAALGKA